MRVLRVLAGIVLLTIAAPAVLAGAFSWYAMQHRDEAGRFRATFAPVAAPGYAVVVPDVDALLRHDAPFTRAGRTSVRLTATAGTQPLFLGLAVPGNVADLLGVAAYRRLDGFSLSRGPVGVSTTPIPFPGTPVAKPGDQPIWLASGIGGLTFEPSDWRGRPVALVVMARDAHKLDAVALAAAVQLGWLESTTWGLLILGPLLLLLGSVVLAWPVRQFVYVMAASRPSASVITWMDVPTVELPLIPPLPLPPSPAVPAPQKPSAPQDRVPQDPRRIPDPAGQCGVWPAGLEWPPRQTERETRPALDLPTQELPILPRVPLQLHGVRLRQKVSASGPTGGGGPTLTGGTV